jgi:DNA invertase Pin-like site-specific DNA recombinase
MKRVALYARVSKEDQVLENQLRQLRDFARLKGWTDTVEYTDHGVSGAKDRRPGLDAMMAEVRAGNIGVVVVWKFDRFGRSLRHLVVTLEELRTRNVGFVSSTEAVDTTTPAGELMFSLLAAMAQFERSMIRERTLAGLDRARSQGKRLGHPPDPDAEERDRQILALATGGFSQRAIAKQLGCSRATVQAALAGGEA